MKKQSIKEFIDENFTPGSAPSPITVRRWCEKGEIKATRLAGRWWVIVDDSIQATGNELIDRVLAG